MALAPVLLFGAALLKLITRLLFCYSKPHKLKLRVPRKGICLFVAFVMLLGPESFQNMAQAQAQYSNLNSASWGQGNRDIHYYYDDNGSVTSKITKVTTTQVELERVVYEYNLQNRLIKVKVSTDGGQSWDSTTEYKYDAVGNRVAKTVDSVTTDYLIDAYNHTGFAQVFVEDDGTDTTSYIIGDDVLAQATNTSNPQYLLYDGHGSTRQTTDNAGVVTDSFSYDAYGVTLGSPASTSTNLLYAGEQFDTHAQRYYLRARYYDPLNGRFNRVDPFEGNNQDPAQTLSY